ncbi:MAG: L-threonylcarbamoyladenylate synthase [Pseudomonadota bacterium]
MTNGIDKSKGAGVEDSRVCLSEVDRAVEVIRRGGIVAFPTETYYGLAVNPFDENAVTRLFSLKKRSSAKPLLMLVANEAQLLRLTSSIPFLYDPLMAFWPGPLTLVFPAHPSLSALVTGNTGTVGARISSHSLAHLLVSRIGHPITATSANISGRPAAVSAGDVASAFGPDVDFILDGGRTPGGKGSTLVGLAGQELVLIREGVIDFSTIKEKIKKKSL